MSNGRILITTGIYPPKIGGPAQYAKGIENAFDEMGYIVQTRTFNLEDYLPTGIRHIFFFIKIIPEVLASDLIITLDTFSVGLPTILAGKIFGKKVIIRTGGDFLWEQYVERTGKKILLRNFYEKEKDKFNSKEKVIFNLTRWTLKNASRVVFSTSWQRNIFIPAYGLNVINTEIIENYYGPKEGDFETNLNDKTFVASTRDLKWKNIDTLKHVFDEKDSNISGDIRHHSVKLLTETFDFENFMEKIKQSYAVILVSLGDISPNIILDAIRLNKPFICTREIGIFDRIKDIGIFIDPLEEKSIDSAVLSLLDGAEYEKWRQKVRNFNFTHTWKDIAGEYIGLYNAIK